MGRYEATIGTTRRRVASKAPIGMITEAAKLGANAIVATRFSTLVMMAGAAELLATGTAVIVED